MFQRKEHDKNSQKQQNKEKIGNLPKNEFRVMTVKMIQDLRIKMEAQTKEIQ